MNRDTGGWGRSSTVPTLSARQRFRTPFSKQWFSQIVVIAMATVLTASCAAPLSRPTVEERVREASAPRPLVIRTAQGVLDDQQSRQLLREITPSKNQAQLLIRMTEIQQGLTGRVLTAGNQTKILVDGPAAYNAMFAAIRSAKHHVHLETFILEDDEVGQQLAELLIDRAENGVEVRVTYDGIGSIDTSDAYFDRLRSHGVQLYEYHPPDPIKDLRVWRINNRHHRKILIVDGRTAFTGGINISDVYRSSSSRRFFAASKEEERKQKEEAAWRDTQIQISGPAVLELQQLFIDLWNEQPDRQIDLNGGYFPRLETRGDDLVQVIDSEGGDDEVKIYDVIHAVVVHAKDHIWITQAYFSPDDALINDLVAAAKRGVDVRMVLPGFSDAPIVMYAARANYAKMLDAGIKIYERTDTVLHAKTMTVDGVWSTIGSSNFDYRSFLHNNEANAVVMGPQFGKRMEDLFHYDLNQCEQVTSEKWAERPWAERVQEQFSKMFRYWF